MVVDGMVFSDAENMAKVSCEGEELTAGKPSIERPAAQVSDFFIEDSRASTCHEQVAPNVTGFPEPQQGHQPSLCPTHTERINYVQYPELASLSHCYPADAHWSSFAECTEASPTFTLPDLGTRREGRSDHPGAANRDRAGSCDINSELHSANT
jgi:hypothetical protein